jgi:ribose 5-phosphate isomerase A
MNAKKIAAERAVDFVEDGMLLGLGTGSTAYWAIQAIGTRMKKQNLHIKAIATSLESERLARELGIEMVPFNEDTNIDLTIDGADEVDEGKNLIKGGGGALLREKIVAYNSTALYIIVDQTKMVSVLGRFPLPVEVAIFAWEKTVAHLARLGCRPVLRMEKASAFLTDNGHYILDCDFKKIPDPAGLNLKIKSIPGVMETGLFVQMADKIIVGASDGSLRVI